MPQRAAPFVALAAAAMVTLSASSARAAPWDKPGYELTFQDEMDGSSLDLSKWTRGYKWGEAVINGELQAYADDAFVEQGGLLSIVGKKQQGQYAGQTLEYTSGVICSLHEQTYGYFEARLKVPKGQGLWPAFWLLGAVGTSGVNEIDILELLGHEPNKAYMTVHWGQSYSVGHESDGSEFSGPDFSADFHTFGLQWDADEIVWSIDGTEHKSYSGPGVPQVNMYVIVNLAVGGGWPGAPDSTTVFPADYTIDYVRAYRRAPDGGSGGSAGASSGGASGSNAGGGAGQGGGGGPDASTGVGGAGGGKPALDGISKPVESGGCGCRAAGFEARTPWAALALALGLALTVRRRRPVIAASFDEESR